MQKSLPDLLYLSNIYWHILKKSILILIAFLTCIFNLSAQTTLESDTLVPKNSKINPEKFIGQNETSFFFLNSSTVHKGVDFTISKYDLRSRKQLFSKYITLEDESKSEVLDAFLCDDKILIFRKLHEKDHLEDYSILLQIMDTTGVVQPKLKEVVKHTASPSNPPNAVQGGFVNTIDFSFYASEDKKKILLVSQEYKNEFTRSGSTVTPTKLFLTVFDAERLIIRSTREVPFDNEKSEPIADKYIIDNNENIFFQYHYISKENTLKRSIGMIGKTSSSTVSKDIKLDLNSHEIQDMSFMIHNGKIYCCAVYRLRTKDYNTANNSKNGYGLLYQTIDLETFTTENVDTAQFTKELISKISGVDGYMRPNCEVVSLRIINDEVYTICQFSSLFRYGNATTVNSGFGSFIVSKYDTKKIKWMRGIPNSLITQTCTRSLCVILPDKNHFRFLYLEHPKIAEKYATSTEYTVLDCETVNYGGSNVICMRIDKSGNLNKEILHRNKKTYLIFVPQSSRLYKPLNFQHYKGITLISSNENNFIPQSYNFVIPLSHNEVLLYFRPGNRDKDAFYKISY